MLYFITHPEVVIDPNIPIPSWPLSEKGRERMQKMLQQAWIKDVDVIFSSTEQKAIDGAGILAKHLGKNFSQQENLSEIDRSSTGYLEGESFWTVVKEFFAHPDQSIQRWEKAADAQRRIVNTVKEIIDQNQNKNIAIVSHGAVGALLLSFLKKTPITQDDDQPGKGGGNYFLIDTSNFTLVHGWKPIDLLQ